MIRRLAACPRSRPCRTPPRAAETTCHPPNAAHSITTVIQKIKESMMTTNQPVALVTGASSGIGKAAALALVEAGFAVVGTSRNTAKVTPLEGVTLLDL